MFSYEKTKFRITYFEIAFFQENFPVCTTNFHQKKYQITVFTEKSILRRERYKISIFWPFTVNPRYNVHITFVILINKFLYGISKLFVGNVKLLNVA